LVILRDPGADHSWDGIKSVFTAGTTLAFGDAVYIKSDGNLGLAKADAIATAQVIGICADTAINNGATGNILVYGTIEDASFALGPTGSNVFLSNATAGGLTAATATTSTHVIKIVGVVVDLDIVFVRPDNTTIEIK